MGKKSRTKGHSFEREIAREFRTIYPEARRGLGQARAARECADVEKTPFWVECKREKRVNVRAAIAQSCEATDGRPYMVVAQDDRGDVFAVVRFDVMLALLACVYDTRRDLPLPIQRVITRPKKKAAVKKGSVTPLAHVLFTEDDKGA